MVNENDFNIRVEDATTKPYAGKISNNPIEQDVPYPNVSYPNE